MRCISHILLWFLPFASNTCYMVNRPLVISSLFPPSGSLGCCCFPVVYLSFVVIFGSGNPSKTTEVWRLHPSENDTGRGHSSEIILVSPFCDPRAPDVHIIQTRHDWGSRISAVDESCHRHEISRLAPDKRQVVLRLQVWKGASDTAAKERLPCALMSR